MVILAGWGQIMPTVKIFTISHKDYWFPKNSLYEPLQVGDREDIGIKRDNTGENITDRNKNYCELTGLYWMWKNDCNYDYIGLDHYRRHFCMNPLHLDKQNSVLTKAQVSSLLDGRIILPKKRHYYIETVYSQYIHAHNRQDLDITREIISKYHRDYLDAFDRHMRRRSLHLFNIFIMPKDIFVDYCEWLFDILFRLEDELDITSYSLNNQRVFGYVAERLLDVYVETNNLKYKELPYVFMEKQNWLEKIYMFLKRKSGAHNGRN